MKLKAKANIDNDKIDCLGSVEIHWERAPQVYITWQFFNGDKLIVAKSENLFLEVKQDNKEELIQKVLKRIQAYRMERKKIFENIEILK